MSRVTIFDFDDKTDYRNNPGHDVFSYHFVLKRELKGVLITIGYLAFYEGKPPGKNKMMWNIKSLEKDDSNKEKMQGLIKTAQEIVQGVKNDKESTLPPVW